MKLKQQPEDFQVEELTAVVPTGVGPFSLYRLEKRGWSTLDAVQAIRQRWKIEPRRVSYGGLKDRHAHTVQYLTIVCGPRRNLQHHEVTLQYLGQTAAPYTSKDIRANRFRITLRGLHPQEIPAAEQALEEMRAHGVANYFDDQRFGSVPQGERFVAQALVQNRYEEALRLALAQPYAYDRGPQKHEKEILRAHWGDWTTCKRLRPHGDARSVIQYLVSHPGDFRGAVVRLRPELLRLYLSAYQSHLWDRILALALTRLCRPEQLVLIQLRLGSVPMHRCLDDAQRAELAHLLVPLPSARLKLPPEDPRAPLIEAVLEEEGLTLQELKIKAFREPFFSNGVRPALCLPAGLTYEANSDELTPGRQKLVLALESPRGSYATLIVKRIQQAVVSGCRKEQFIDASSVSRRLAEPPLTSKVHINTSPAPSPAPQNP